MKIFFFACLMTVSLLTSAQPKLEGIVYLYRENGENIPLADVNIIGPGSGSLVTKENGYYSFSFDNSVTATLLSVRKAGYEVINGEDLNVDLKQNKRQNIYLDIEGNTEKRKRQMLDAALLQLKKTRDKYYNILEKGGEEAEKLANKLAKEAGKQHFLPDEAKTYVYERFGGDVKNIDRIVAFILRMNLDHANKNVEKMKKYTLAGDLSSALALLDFGKGFRTVRGNNELIKSAGESNRAEKELFLSALPLLLSNQLYGKVDSSYQLAVLADPADMDLLTEYAYFLKGQMEFNRSLSLYEQVYRSLKPKQEIMRAVILVELGELLVHTHQEKQAGVYFRQAMAVFRKHAIKDPLMYLEMGRISAGLGAVHAASNNPDSAIQYFQECMQLAGQYLVSKSPALSNVLKDIGGALGKNDQSAMISSFNELLVLMDQLKDKLEMKQDAYEIFVASTFRHIGRLWGELGDKAAAERYFENSLSKLRTLAEKNPGVCEPEMAETLEDLGILYEPVAPAKARQIYYQLVEVYRKLSQRQPNVYQPYLANTLVRLGNLLENVDSIKKASDCYEQMLGIYKVLSDSDQETYGPKYAISTSVQATLFYKNGQYGNALPYYKASLDMYKRLAAGDHEKYDTIVVNILNNMALTALKQQKPNDAIPFYEEALQTEMRFKPEQAEALRFDRLRWAYTLGAIYTEQDNYARAAAWYHDALSDSRILYNSGRAKFKMVSDMYSSFIGAYRSAGQRDSVFFYLQAFAEDARPIIAQKPENTSDLDMAETVSALAEAYNYLCMKDSSAGYYAIVLLYQDRAIAALRNPGNEKMRRQLVRCNGNASWYALHAKAYARSEQYAVTALRMDSSSRSARTNLAHSILLQGRFGEAEKIYMELRSLKKEEDDSKTRSQIILEDIESLTCSGAIPADRLADVEKIQKLMAR